MKIHKLFLISFSIFFINQVKACRCENKEIIALIQTLTKSLNGYLQDKETFVDVEHEIESVIIKHANFINLFGMKDQITHSAIASKILNRFFDRKVGQRASAYTSLLESATEKILFDVIKEVAIEEGIPVLVCLCGMCIIV